MTPEELARKYFGEYKVHNGEIRPKYCPFCGGGQKKDANTFAMNAETGTFNCLRKKCDVQGSFWDICRHFGEHPEGYKVEDAVRQPPKKKQYKKQKVKARKPGRKVEQYLAKRGFSRETWQRRGVKEKNGAIMFPYHENGELVLVKYRRPEKYTGKGSKYWQEGGGKPVLWGMDGCDPRKPLIITEGECDALALDEAGVDNAVSIPFGVSNTDWIEECWEFLEQFDKIILWVDNDDSGRDMLQEVVPRLGEWRCYIAHGKHNDANEELYKEGTDAVIEATKNAEEVPIRRLVRMSEVETLDPSKMGRAFSGISHINRLLGGYIYGTITLWTGDNAAGKSTFLSQEMIECVDRQIPVVIYSGELPHGLLRYWMHLQMAGQGSIREKPDQVENRSVYYVPKEIEQRLVMWYRDYLFLYDHLQQNGPQDIIDVFTNAARRHGCKVFLLDNLMAVNYGGRKGEYYHRQSEFVTRLKEFADKFNCHVHIVAHPKKSDERLTKDDIAGLKELSNKADNAIAIHRIEEDNQDNFEENVQDCDAVIDILKSRIYGKQNVSVGLFFEEMSKRFFQPSDPDGKVKPYGWSNIKLQKELA